MRFKNFFQRDKSQRYHTRTCGNYIREAPLQSTAKKLDPKIAAPWDIDVSCREVKNHNMAQWRCYTNAIIDELILGLVNATPHEKY